MAACWGESGAALAIDNSNGKEVLCRAVLTYKVPQLSEVCPQEVHDAVMRVLHTEPPPEEDDPEAESIECDIDELFLGLVVCLFLSRFMFASLRRPNPMSSQTSTP